MKRGWESAQNNPKRQKREEGRIPSCTDLNCLRELRRQLAHQAIQFRNRINLYRQETERCQAEMTEVQRKQAQTFRHKHVFILRGLKDFILKEEQNRGSRIVFARQIFNSLLHHLEGEPTVTPMR